MTPITAAALLLALAGTGLVLAALRIRREDPVRALAAEFGSEANVHLDEYHRQLEDNLVVRLLAPVARAMQSVAGRLTPSTALDATRERLVTAGLTGRISAEEYLAFRLLSGGGGVLVGIGMVAAVGGVQGVALGALTTFIGFAVPRGYVDRARQARVDAIEKELPDALDLLAISVEAGLGFEQALSAVVDRSTTVLGAELGHTLREMQLGRTRVEALHELQRRVDVPDLHSLVLALVQADALGMPLTRILRTQAAELRRRRRQRTREKAAKLPVKILFPMVLFILPALLVVVLGPAILTLMRAI